MKGLIFTSLLQVFLFLGLVGLAGAADSRKCYFPNGKLAPDTPCGTDKQLCCGPGAQCLSNLLCYDPTKSALDGFIRGSCTDPTWSSPGCPSFCQDVNPGGGDGVVSCGTNGWCCDADVDKTCHCNNGTGTFKLDSPQVWTTIGVLGASTVTVTPTFTSSSRPSSTLSTSTSTSSSTSLSSSSSASAASTPTSSASTTDSSSKLAIGVGAGVGVPLGLAAIGFVLWLFLRRGSPAEKGNVPDHFPTSDEKDQANLRYQSQVYEIPSQRQDPIELSAHRY